MAPSLFAAPRAGNIPVGQVMTGALPLVNFHLGTVMLRQTCPHSSLQLLFCPWDVATDPWLLPHQAALARRHMPSSAVPGSCPGRGNHLPSPPRTSAAPELQQSPGREQLSALASSCTSPGRLPRLRPLYQYINFDMPELMCPSEEKGETLGPAGTATGLELEGELPQGSVCLLGYLESHWVSSSYACSLWQRVLV